MASLKDEMIGRDERGYGWIGDDTFVCADCVGEPELRAFVRDELDAAPGSIACSYCGRVGPSPIAVPVDRVLEEVADAVFTEYEPADPSLFDHETGDWLMPTFGTGELFGWELGIEFGNPAFAEDIIGAFIVDPWSERDPLWLDPGEALIAGWESFSYQVMHVTRYLYFEEHKYPFDDGVPATEILARIGEAVGEHDLVTELPAGSHIFRSRWSDAGTPLATVAELGAPTAEQAVTSSRMSAAGIAVFYGAFDRVTAIDETLAHVAVGDEDREVDVWWATFSTNRPMRALDLRRVPAVPGLLGPARHQRPAIRFLRTFADEVAKPIPIDGREHIGYVPTQVVAEYFRYAYRSADGDRVDGIVYPSAARPGGASCVLFLSGDNCGLPGETVRDGRPIEVAMLPGSVANGRFEASDRRCR